MAGAHSIKAGVHFTGDIGPNRIKIPTIASNRNCASDKGHWALDFLLVAESGYGVEARSLETRVNPRQQPSEKCENDTEKNPVPRKHWHVFCRRNELEYLNQPKRKIGRAHV